jgi:hypothetical protein
LHESIAAHIIAAPLRRSYYMSKVHEEAPKPELQEVRLDEVNEQDAIILETASGSTYNLKVIESHHGRPLIIMDRQSDHPARTGERPVDIDELLKFRILGSCQGSLSSPDGETLVPVAPIDKLVMVGKSVRLQSEGGDPLLTSPVTSIKWVKADSESAPA